MHESLVVVVVQVLRLQPGASLLAGLNSSAQSPIDLGCAFKMERTLQLLLADCAKLLSGDTPGLDVRDSNLQFSAHDALQIFAVSPELFAHFIRQIKMRPVTDDVYARSRLPHIIRLLPGTELFSGLRFHNIRGLFAKRTHILV